MFVAGAMNETWLNEWEPTWISHGGIKAKVWPEFPTTWAVSAGFLWSHEGVS